MLSQCTKGEFVVSLCAANVALGIELYEHHCSLRCCQGCYRTMTMVEKKRILNET